MANMANTTSPAKRATKQAPTKKTTAAAAPTPPEDDAPEAVDEGAGAVPERPTIEIRGRHIAVIRPRDEQLIIWNRTVNRLRALTDDTPRAEVDLLTDRALRVIQSAIADQVDREWLEDQMLDAGMTLLEATTIIAKAQDLGALAPAATRAAAPTTGPKARPRR